MNKHAYFIEALRHDKGLEYGWIISVFLDSKPISPSLPYDLVRDNDGYYFKKDNGLEKIDDADPSKKLFDFSDEILLEKGDLVNVIEPVQTTRGNALVNATLLVYPFGDKIPYMTGRILGRDIESIVADKLVDDDSNISSGIPVKDYLNYVKATEVIGQLSKVVAYTTTPKNISPPPGIEQYKKSVLKKLKDEGKDISDPLVLVEFEEKLLKYDSEFLKDDPSLGRVMSGKLKDKARMKMFLSYGSEAGFESGAVSTPITRSLSQGLVETPRELTDVINSIRSGSYSRGNSTIKGGISGKMLLRAVSGFTIVKNNCNTKDTIEVTIAPHFVKGMLNRTIIVNNKSLILTKDNIGKYLGKTVNLRSPMRCKAKGGYCGVCVGSTLANNDKNIVAYASAISGKIMSAFFKKMHSIKLTLVNTDIDTAID